jgi:oligoendopeptidase F
MSAGNAAARQRRAGGVQIDPPGKTVQAPQPSPSAGLTLPQVIQLVDARLIKLETFVKSQADKPADNSVSQELVDSLHKEFNEKFEMLAEEIADLKDIVLKLQSYTMEVNKTLMEDRIHILSNNKVNIDDVEETFVLGEEDLSNA